MTEIKIDKLVRSKRRSIALIVAADASLIVRAPWRVPLGYIEDLVFKKRLWIKVKKQQASKMMVSAPVRKYQAGEEFLFLGEAYKLKITESSRISLTHCLNLPEKFLPDAREKMTDWYREQAMTIIRERADWFARTTGWQYRIFRISNARGRWGSCGPADSINISWRLVMAPLSAVDYVVVHELAHICEKNHGRAFWDKVEAVLPDYKDRRQWLKDHHRLLQV